MAYDKHTWTCDEPITVERLNHIEDGIANAGGGDCGFECETTITLLTEESVTTELQEGDPAATCDLSYSQLIDAESIKVTFNGTVYECEKTVEAHGGSNYGAPHDDSTNIYDWSEYPFNIWSDDVFGVIRSNIATETAGTYTIKIEAVETTVTTSSCFDKARGYSCSEAMRVLISTSVTMHEQGENMYVADLPYSKVIDADTITVIFNGTQYECERIAIPLGNGYGGWNASTGNPDFSQYPFAIGSTSGSDGNHTGLLTDTAGTYPISIIAMSLAADSISPCFEAAVEQANRGMGSIVVPQQAITATVKRSTGLTGSPYVVPANSSATVRFTFSERLSENAALRRIIVPTGILLGKIQPLQSAYADLDVYNVTANSITLTNDNMSMEFVDFKEPNTICVMMSDACSSPGPSPK